jgi:DNA-directed RNA polymerase specialized sigma24 family protein
MSDADLGRGASRGGQAHVQPAVDTRAWNFRSAEHLGRLLGDVDLMQRLHGAQFSDEEWEPVATEFARYGVDVLRAWVATGKVFIKVYAITQVQLSAPREAFDEHTAQTLADDTVLAALQAFPEKVLKVGRWDPARGATLKTYFIGQCMWQFLNVYRAWVRERDKAAEAQAAAVVVDTERSMSRAVGPEQEVLRRQDLEVALALVSTDAARKAFLLQEMGYTHDEIAEHVGLADAKAVENALAYQRQRLRDAAIRRTGT